MHFFFGGFNLAYEIDTFLVVYRFHLVRLVFYLCLFVTLGYEALYFAVSVKWQYLNLVL